MVSTLTKSLGVLLGGVLSGLTYILTFGQVKVDLGKTLGDVLDARKKDPTALATGTLAGRIAGEVEFSDIEVVNADVKNINGYTGGIVGYATGVTQYDGLSNALGGIVDLLSNILNVIPGLGLGDLMEPVKFLEIICFCAFSSESTCRYSLMKVTLSLLLRALYIFTSDTPLAPIISNTCNQGLISAIISGLPVLAISSAEASRKLWN